MIELMNPIIESFSIYFGTILRAPLFLIHSWRGIGVAVLALSLILALAMIFLCDGLMKKYDLELPPAIIMTTLILSLTVGLIGLCMSIPALANAFHPFLIIGLGSPVLNFVISILVVQGNRLKNRSTEADILFLGGVGFLFGWSLAATPIIFFYTLYNY